MMNFYEYASWKKKTTLPDAVTMLQKAGIDPAGPHEVEVMRLTKAMRKAAEWGPARGRANITSSNRLL